MKMTIAKENIIKEIQLAQGVAPFEGKSNLPILSNVLMEVFDDKLKMTASDLEINLKCELKANVLEPGSMALSAKMLSDIIREMPPGEITFKTEEEGNKINISNNSVSFYLCGQLGEDFPQFPQLTDSKSFFLPASILKEMIKKTIFAVSKDELRPILKGVFLSLSGNKIEMAATDGHRLSVIKQDIDIDFETPISVIIPTRAVEELSKIMEEEESVRIDITEREVGFTSGNIVLISRLIEGDFPNYRSFIPNEYRTKVKINRSDFLDACRRISLLSSAIIKFSISEGKIIINSATSEIGEARQELHIDIEGEEIEIGFKPIYVIDGVKNMRGDEIYLTLVSQDKSGVISSPQEEGYIYLVMPMRI
ncbi:MAG: DNA polymerase III subunit beta [bacterium]